MKDAETTSYQEMEHKIRVAIRGVVERDCEMMAMREAAKSAAVAEIAEHAMLVWRRHMHEHRHQLREREYARARQKAKRG